jgi:uncharacterized repeat protein (TIGR04052 family)
MPDPALLPRLARAAVFALLTLCGCSESAAPVTLHFAATYGGRPIGCTESPNGLSLTDLRFYVHDIALFDQAGNRVPLNLEDDGLWQDGNVALLDFEDGQGACLNGSPQLNESVRGRLRGGPFHKVSLTVGVPEDINHSDPLVARAPLNYTAMHWHWLTGYKFLRAGIGNDLDSFWIHLGSSRCDGSIAQGIECAAPNRVRVEIADFDLNNDRIAIDLEALFANIDLTDGIASDCSSGPEELACLAPFAALGLGPGDAPPSSAVQTVFLGEAAP